MRQGWRNTFWMIFVISIFYVVTCGGARAGSLIKANYLNKGYKIYKTEKIDTKGIKTRDEVVIVKKNDEYVLLVESAGKVYQVGKWNGKAYSGGSCYFSPYIFYKGVRSPCELSDNSSFGIGYEWGENCKVSCYSYEWNGSNYKQSQ